MDEENNIISRIT